uniref:Uncharacterized protein n=1 Tax=Arundo donax TaxID=35708 RepID=A0A0A9BQE4_ARUDO
MLIRPFTNAIINFTMHYITLNI